MLSFTVVDTRKQLWEFGALVTSTDAEILTLGQAHRDRADSENDFDEFRNQRGWAGFTTQDRTRCQLMARSVALVFNWWYLFARLADPENHREAITTRPSPPSAIARRTSHAGQVTSPIASMHAARDERYRRIAEFLPPVARKRQLDPLEKWYQILSEAMTWYLKRHRLQPPHQLSQT